MGVVDSVHDSVGQGDGPHSRAVNQKFTLESLESRLVISSLQAQCDEMARLATMTGAALARLSSGAGARDRLADEMRNLIPRWHFAMVNDHERNDALAVALERRVRPGSTVLDIGSGTGLLAMMAVRAGAASVISCEANPVMAEIARQIVADHGMSQAITVIPKRSTDLVVGRDLKAPVDLVVSEIVDCGLIGEGLLPTITHAREHLLAPHGRMLPATARLRGCLIDSPVIANLNRAGTAGGFDVRLLNTVATQGHFPVRLSTWPHRIVSDTVELAYFDLEQGSLDDGETQVRCVVERPGTAYALVAWFEMDLGAGVVLRNSPDNVGSHWMQALLPLAAPIQVTPGDHVRLTVSWRGTRLGVVAHPTALTTEV